TLDAHAASRISRLVAAKPDGGYGGRRSRLEDYGLDPAAERDRYARYVERFGIRPERSVDAARPVKGSAAPGPRRLPKKSVPRTQGKVETLHSLGDLKGSSMGRLTGDGTRNCGQ